MLPAAGVARIGGFRGASSLRRRDSDDGSSDLAGLRERWRRRGGLDGSAWLAGDGVGDVEEGPVVTVDETVIRKSKQTPVSKSHQGASAPASGYIREAE